MTLRDACEKLLTYRKQAGPLGYQLEKADDYHRMIRAALDAPDITADLADVCRQCLNVERQIGPHDDIRGPHYGLIERLDAVLKRYDAQRGGREI